MNLKEFFYMQKSDRHVALALLVILLIAGILFVVTGEENTSSWSLGKDGKDSSTVNDNTQTRSGNQHRIYNKDTKYTYATEEQKAELFDFDPNTADSTQLLRLGLQPWQVRNIYRYRAAGGIYRRPEDFARLYGLTAGQYRALAPHIRIGEDYRPAAEIISDNKVYADKPSSADTTTRLRKLHPGEKIALNTKDTVLLKRVPGIGDYFAHAIVAYAEKLGGYCKVEQLMEIRNFPETALDFFNEDGAPTRRLNLNRLSLQQMRQHPYIGFYRAKEIVEYRRLHGPINSLDDLRLLPDFTPEAISRLLPYVEF